MTKYIENGTKVTVSPETPSGKPLPCYTGVVEDVRTGVKCIGSVEYLIKWEDGETPSSKWVYAQYVKPEGA